MTVNRDLENGEELMSLFNIAQTHGTCVTLLAGDVLRTLDAIQRV